MTVDLFMDQNVAGTVTRGLRRRDIALLTAAEDGKAAWDDERLFAHAAALGRVFVSRDEDLLVIASRWLRGGREFAGLIYYPQRLRDIGSVIDDLWLIATVETPNSMRNRVIYLPL